MLPLLFFGVTMFFTEKLSILLQNLKTGAVSFRKVIVMPLTRWQLRRMARFGTWPRWTGRRLQKKCDACGHESVQKLKKKASWSSLTLPLLLSGVPRRRGVPLLLKVAPRGGARASAARRLKIKRRSEGFRADASLLHGKSYTDITIIPYRQDKKTSKNRLQFLNLNFWTK